MKAVNVKAVRVGSDVWWMFATSYWMPEGFAEAWGKPWVTDGKKVVLVMGRDAGLIAMDWLRDRGVEPKRVKSL